MPDFDAMSADWGRSSDRQKIWDRETPSSEKDCSYKK